MNKLIPIPREIYVTPEVETLTAEVNKLHRRISKKARAMLDLYAEAGFKLLAIKKQIGHGCWSKWLDNHFLASRETARAYIRIAENWDNLQTMLKQAKRKGKQLGLAQALALIRIERNEQIEQEKYFKEPRTPLPNLELLEVMEARRSLGHCLTNTLKTWERDEVVLLGRHSRGNNSRVLQHWLDKLKDELKPIASLFVEAENHRDTAEPNSQVDYRKWILHHLGDDAELTELQKELLDRNFPEDCPFVDTTTHAKELEATDQILGLVPCGDTKVEKAVPARDLYKGSGFKCAARWAQKNCIQWFILSAEHGLLPPDKVTEPYDTYLPKLSKEEQRAWAEKVRKQLAGIKLPLVYLGGKDYLEILNAGQSKLPIIDLFKAIEVSNRGKRASWLKHNPKLTNELREKLGLPLKTTAKVDKKTIAKPTKHKQTKQTTPTQ